MGAANLGAFDEHGVGRCPICGGAGKQSPGFTLRRLRFSARPLPLRVAEHR
jgi:hypothetical protein